jgi:ParB-like chromosome segregation protein Spo0J
MQQHPLSAAFPPMEDVEFKRLCADIETHGLRNPVVTLDGMVLDGWHRYRACLETGREPMVVQFDGDDPRTFVLSLNLSRRHLTASQRAAAVVAVADWKPVGKPQVGANSAPSAELLAKQADVSPRTIEHTKKAFRAGRGEDVRDGKVSAKAAAAPVRPSEPEEEQATTDDPRLTDLVIEFESLLRIVEADDKLAEAWHAVKAAQQSLAQMTAMYEGKCRELAEMTKEAKRWKRKAEAK